MTGTHKNRLIYSILLVLIAIVFSFISLNYFVSPFVWIGFAWLMVCIFYFIISGEKARIVLINIMVVLFTLSSFEAFVWIYMYRATRHIKQTGNLYKKDYYFRVDDLLGYSPNKNVTANAKKFYKDELLFNVNYTIDDKGLRQSPPLDTAEHHDCILFFGCSMVFGEGLEDDETIPYQLGLLSDGKYNIYTFGFHGYGPHQMLSALQNGLTEKVLKNNEPIHVIYVGLIEHALRSAGKISWDQHAPRYTLKDGTVYYDGRFDDGIFYTNPVLAKVYGYLNKSHIWQKIIEKRRVMTDADVELFLSIIKQAQIEVARLYPNAKFDVIMWNSSKYEEYARAQQGFDERNLSITWINEILPHYDENIDQYRIHPKHEKHPNAYANRIVARYVLDHFIDPPQVSALP